ncbi:MAG: UDP-2,3-diacylglucosamine hydrolase [Patiriisocius sp.]|jgi:UDP-2,3-diacylglucosamine hydrolase
MPCLPRARILLNHTQARQRDLREFLTLMTDILISDLHLDQSRPEITAGFLHFLGNGLVDATALYILGDFFEVWLGDDHDTAFNQKIIQALEAVDIPIYFMHGNRDFLLGTAFCSQIGATLLPDPSILELNGEKVLLMHGDSLCTSDTEYMKVRVLLRNEAFQADFLTKSIPERQAFADQARGESKAHTRETAADIMDVTESEVIRVMLDSGVRTLIHGHTHRPATHKVDLGDNRQGQRIVLGDWGSHGWQIHGVDGKFELTSFPLDLSH